MNPNPKRATTKEPPSGTTARAVRTALPTLSTSIVPTEHDLLTPGTSDGLLTPVQVSDRLQVPVGTLYQWRVRRLGPKALRVGKHLRYRPEDVAAWIAEQLAQAQ